MLSIKNGIQSPETSPTGGHRPFEYPLVADSRLASQGEFNVQVAKWLVQTAEDHASPETAAKRKTETSSTGKPVVPSIFLSCVHAIMALHRLAPFNQPSKTVVLSAGGLKLSLRAIELLVSGTREKIQSAMHEGNGKVLPDTVKTGLLRLLGDGKSGFPGCFCRNADISST